MKIKTVKFLAVICAFAQLAAILTGCGTSSETGRSVEDTIEVFFETVVRYHDDVAYKQISKSGLVRNAFLESVGFREWEEKPAPGSDIFKWRLTSGDKPEYKLIYVEYLDYDAAKAINESFGLNVEKSARAYIDSNIFGLDPYLTCVLVDGDWYLFSGVKIQ